MNNNSTKDKFPDIKQWLPILPMQFSWQGSNSECVTREQPDNLDRKIFWIHVCIMNVNLQKHSMLRLKRHGCKCNAQLLHEFSVRISTEPYVLDSNMDLSDT